MKDKDYELFRKYFIEDLEAKNELLNLLADTNARLKNIECKLKTITERMP